MLLLLLGRVALVAQRPIVVKLSRGRSVGPYVRLYMFLSDPVYTTLYFTLPQTYDAGP